MKTKSPVTWWDHRTGAACQAELVSGVWHVWKRDWADVHWYEVEVTEAIRQRIEEELSGTSEPASAIAA